jgi:hypothetical protein
MSRTEFNVAFKIHPKPDGGFEAVSENPPIRIEGATREDVEKQVKVKLVELLGPEIAAMLPVSFADRAQPSGQNQATFTVKKTVHIGGSLKNGDSEIASAGHTFTLGGIKKETGPPYSTPAGDVVSSSSSSAEDAFGPVRRTGDGSSAMLMLRIIVAAIVIVAVMYFLRQH